MLAEQLINKGLNIMTNTLKNRKTEFGKVLNKALSDLKITKKFFCAEVRISQSNLHALESGKLRVSKFLEKRIRGFFTERGVNLPYFETFPFFNRNTIVLQHFTKEGQEKIKAFASEIYKKEVLEYTKTKTSEEQ